MLYYVYSEQYRADNMNTIINFFKNGFIFLVILVVSMAVSGPAGAFIALFLWFFWPVFGMGLYTTGSVFTIIGGLALLISIYDEFILGIQIFSIMFVFGIVLWVIGAVKGK